MTTPLAQVLTFPCGLVLANRIVKTALQEGLGTEEFGVSSELVQLYDLWGASGAGLLITGGVSVDRRYPGSPACVVLDDVGFARGQRERFEQWNEAGQRHGGRVLMQLNHPGRAIPRSLCRRPVAPSALRARDLKDDIVRSAPPRAMTDEEVQALPDQFAKAARFAQQAGFDGVQIQAGHGQLISQFLSPRWNKRSDRWGGTLENRSRLLLEVLRACCASVSPGFAISVRLSAIDGEPDGICLDDTLQLVDWLNAEAVDLLDVSVGGLAQPAMLGLQGRHLPIHEGRLGQPGLSRGVPALAYARAVNSRSRMPILVSGGFRSAAVLEGAITDQYTDLVGLGRSMCLEPDLPMKLLRQQDAQFGSGEVIHSTSFWQGIVRQPCFFSIRKAFIRSHMSNYQSKLQKLGTAFR